MPVPFGQIIQLKPGSEEPYIILHKNTFPSVLQRIARSNFTNYSIFLLNDTLFGYYEYTGNDYAADTAAISQDQATQEWWKLTAPLQQPVIDCNPGDWWTDLELIFQHHTPGKLHHPVKRSAWFIKQKNDLSAPGEFQAVILENPALQSILNRMLVFKRKDHLFYYFEFEEDQNAALPHLFFKENHALEMKEVFHTNGEKAEKAQKKVFVTGCFDMLHSGHVEFLREAASFGSLNVCIGSDANIHQLKGRPPVNSQEERKYMLDAVRYVSNCVINKGWGIMDFIEEIEEIRPDVFVVNEDGNTPAKAELCARLGIEYKVMKRLPHDGLPVRSTTALRSECRIPFRIDLAGGWLDQPFVSSYYPGPVITISIEPTLEFNDRSGMASSTRRKAIELWNTNIPHGDPEQLARILFSFDNPPGTKDVSGSQDALGIVMPGLNKLFYHGHYWPEKITSVHDEALLSWLENHLQLVSLGPRQADYDVVNKTFISEENAKRLAEAAGQCWESILKKDSRAFGHAFREAFHAQVSMFPNMVDDNILKIIEQYKDMAYGWKLSGAGGGGYLILVTDKPVEGTIRIKIRRSERV